MRFSVLKEIYGQPWQIEAGTFQQFFPLAVGAMQGADFVPEPEPRENLPYCLHPVTLETLAWQPAAGLKGDSVAGVTGSGIPQPKVVSIIPVRGLMLRHDQACGPVGTRTLAARLQEADQHDSILGHVLVFETGGGSANSVPELAQAITGCSKPVVAWVDGMMCSAGQFAGSYCREIIASRENDLVGSIGTMMVYEGRKALSEEDQNRVIHLRIYADDASQKNQEYEAAINQYNFSLVRERVLNPHNLEFVNAIRANRPGVEEQHLHGRTFRAREVLGALVDRIGSLEDAVRRVAELAGLDPQSQADDYPGSQSQSQETVGLSAVSDSTDESNIPIVFAMKYPKIMNALGLDNASFVFEPDGRRTFTLQEMDALESALGADHSGELHAANTLLQSRLDEVNAALAGSEERIRELEQQTSQLRSAAADDPVTVVTHTNTLPAAGESGAIADKYENPFDALQEVAQSYLGKTL